MAVIRFIVAAAVCLLLSIGAHADILQVSPRAGSAGVSFTDGTHTVSNATALAVTGGTVGGTSPNATLTVSGGGSTVPFWVLRDDNAGTAPTAGGTGNAAGDLLTLNDSCATHGVLAVVGVSTGAVTQFLVSTRGSCATLPTGAIGVSSSTGSGTGATFTLNYVPGSTVDAFEGANAAVNGGMILGSGAGLGQQNAGLGITGFGFQGMGGGGNTADGLGGGTGLVAAANEDTGIGFKSLTQCVTCEFMTGVGLNAFGHNVNGALEDCFGTDCGKYDNNSSDNSMFGTNDAKYAWNMKGVTTVGPVIMGGQFINPTVTGAVSNGGLVRLTVPTTNITTNDCVFVNSVGGVTGANTNGTCVYVTVINGTTLDLQGTTFGGTYTSGGSVIDMPLGFSNQAVSGAISNGGLIELTVANTINMVTGDTAHVSGVGGVSAATGTWTITVRDAQCLSACRVDLQGSTFSGTYTSGGRITDLTGPRNMMLGGYNVLSGNITGAMSGLTILGSTAAASAISLGDSTIIGNGCGTGRLGSNGNNYGIILLCVDSSTDVVSTSVVDSIGMGQGIGLCNTSVQIGFEAGFHNNVTSACIRETIIGFEAGLALTSGTENTYLGSKVGSVTLATGSDNLLAGVNAACDTPAGNTSNYIGICGPAGVSLAIANTGTLATESATLRGSLTLPDGPILIGGTKFTTSGCSISATTGQGTAGTYTSGTTGSCPAVITLNGATGITAPTGWLCWAYDTTTPADAQLQTASTATGCTITGTTVSGDVIRFAAVAY